MKKAIGKILSNEKYKALAFCGVFLVILIIYVAGDTVISRIVSSEVQKENYGAASYLFLWGTVKGLALVLLLFGPYIKAWRQKGRIRIHYGYAIAAFCILMAILAAFGLFGSGIASDSILYEIINAVMFPADFTIFLFGFCMIKAVKREQKDAKPEGYLDSMLNWVGIATFVIAFILISYIIEVSIQNSASFADSLIWYCTKPLVLIAFTCKETIRSWFTKGKLKIKKGHLIFSIFLFVFSILDFTGVFTTYLLQSSQLAAVIGACFFLVKSFFREPEPLVKKNNKKRQK